LLAGTPWRRLFHRQINYLPLWRKAQKILKSKQRILRADQYRGVCKSILQVDRNWRTGNFTKLIYPVHSESCNITISDDFVAWDFDGFQRLCVFLDTESMEIQMKEIPSSVKEYDKFNERMVFWQDSRCRKLEIVDPNNSWVVDVYPEGDYVDWGCYGVVFGNNLLVHHHCSWNWERIRIWKMGNPPVLLKDQTCEDRNLIFFSSRRTVHGS